MTRLAFQLFGTLLVVGMVFHYIWWILAGIAAWWVWSRRHRIEAWFTAQQQARNAARAAEERRLAEIRARADRQHNWRMSGDERGIYGEAWPTVQKYQQAVNR